MNDLDLSHINKQIQNNLVDIEAKRRQADNHRLAASQNSDNRDYYDKAADQLEDQAIELENEIDQLAVEKEIIRLRGSNMML